jgi:hypothetical protein
MDATGVFTRVPKGDPRWAQLKGRSRLHVDDLRKLHPNARRISPTIPDVPRPVVIDDPPSDAEADTEPAAIALPPSTPQPPPPSPKSKPAPAPEPVPQRPAPVRIPKPRRLRTVLSRHGKRKEPRTPRPASAAPTHFTWDDVVSRK